MKTNTFLTFFLLLPLIGFAQNQKPALPAGRPASPVGRGVSPIAPELARGQQSLAKNTYAVVVGISDYQDKDIPDLRFADKDAEAFANFLRSEAGGSLNKDHLKVLLNQEATMAQFAIALDWLWENVKEGDQAIIYFSGHGDVEKKSLTQPGFLLCWDAPARVYMSGGTFALPMLQEVISTLSIQNKAKVIVITDACRSGTLAGNSVGGAQATASNLSKQFANEIKILSCQPNEYSIEGEQWGGGRGAFSFNLVNALYGLADGNKDLSITLQEIGRYLEDHVPAEVAPVPQLPMVLGNRSEKVATVNPAILAALQSGKSSQITMLSAIDSRGIEDEVLAGLDTTVIVLYQLFKKALKEKAFLEPANASADADKCADAYYKRLLAEPGMGRLHSTMTRNYAAALQDDAQQAINIWLKADVLQLECIGKSLKLQPIPQQLRRAAELLGEGHYMYRSLQARRLLFEGILLCRSKNPDEALGRECLSYYRQSLALEPQSALAWHRISEVYASNLRLPDSALVCVRKGNQLSPNWVLPLVDLGYALLQQRNMTMAKKVLEEAEGIDPKHPLVLNLGANWLKAQPGPTNQADALVLFERYQAENGPMYPCWHNDYGLLLVDLGRFEESESEFLKAIALDSTNNAIWLNLGYLYQNTNRIAEAERLYKKAMVLNSLDVYPLNLLGLLYVKTRRYDEGEKLLKKAVALDSTFVSALNNLAYWAIQTRRYDEAEPVLKKAIALDSTYSATLISLAFVYKNTKRHAEAEPLLKKAIALDSSYAISWISLGYVYLETQQYTEAERVLQHAIALDSTFANPLQPLGMVYFKTNRPDQARQSFLKALALDPNYKAALLALAYLLQSEGKTEEAIGYVAQSIVKGNTFEQLEKDDELAALRATTEWKTLMKKYFPNQFKD